MKVKFGKPKFNLEKFANFFVNIGSNTLSQFFVLIIALVFLNIVSQKVFLRIDLTDTRIYTLGQGTKDILDKLEDPVTIKLFFSENIPPNIIPVSQDVKDIYKEYERFSNGKVKLEVKNPSDANFETEAEEAGIPAIQFSELTADKFEIAQRYLGASITYKDQSETIEVLTEISTLEYETSSRIYKLTTEEKGRVGFLTGHGERNLFSDYTKIRSLLERQFDVGTVDLSEGEPIDPNENKVLVIAQPTSEFSERDKFEIDQYIMNGGRVIILADPLKLQLQSTILTSSSDNLDELINYYGATISKSVLLDESYLPITSGFTQIAYPFWVLVQSENINHQNPALSQQESVVLFWPSAIQEAKTNEDQTFTPLAKTTDQAWEKTGESISIDFQEFIPTDQKQYIVASLIEGKQVSLFKDKEIPALESSDDEEIEDKRTDEDQRQDEVEDAKIIIIADSDFISDNFIEGTDQNPAFFLNLLEWQASAKELMSIRSKNIDYRPLEIVSDSSKWLIKAANVVSVPTLLILAGIAYNRMRKKRESRI